MILGSPQLTDTQREKNRRTGWILAGIAVALVALSVLYILLAN